MVILEQSNADTLGQSLLVGLTCGAGFSAAVTTVNAISPNVPRPYLYAAVVGSYHLVGTVLCAIIIYVML